SGGELLAAARAASGDHLAAADRRHAGAKAVATLAHDLAGLIGPLHGLVSELQSSAENRAPPDPERADADAAATSETKRQAGKMNAAPDAPLQGAGLCRAGASKSIVSSPRL